MSTTETKQQADTGINKTQQEQEQTSFEPITSQEQLDKLITSSSMPRTTTFAPLSVPVNVFGKYNV